MDNFSSPAILQAIASQGPLIAPLLYGDYWPGSQVTFSFAPAGAATYTGGYTGGSPTTSVWTAAQMDFVRDAFAHIATFTNLQFVEVVFGSRQNIAFQSVAEVPGGWGGYAGTPSNTAGVHVVIGQSFIDPADGNVLIHEIGHSLGLRHPHDGGFPGVDFPDDPGDFGLNSNLFTVMSYRNAYDPLNPDILMYGDRPFFAALDIAALQALYGVNTTYAAGNTVYGQTENVQAIWDTGGTDTIDFRSATGKCVIDLRAATLLVAPGGGGFFSFVSDPTSWHSNIVLGGGYTIANGVVVENGFAGAGDDRLQGNGAINFLSGGLGIDTLRGGANNDILQGDGGNDLLFGGIGNDTVVYAAVVDTVVNLGTRVGGNLLGTDQLVGIENVTAADGDDRLTGDTLANRLIGGAGSDLLGGVGGRDVLRGGAGDDSLLGGFGTDLVFGDAGSDLLTGGLGADDLFGGSGLDTFVFNSAAEIGLGLSGDVVMDFAPGSDRLNFAAMHLQFIGMQAFTGVAGQLRFDLDAAQGYLSGDTDGDGIADFSLILTGVTRITAADLVL